MPPIKHIITAAILFLTVNQVLAAQEPPAADNRREITLASIPDPEKYSVENRGGPLDFVAGIGALASRNIELNRSMDLQVEFLKSNFDVRNELEAALLKELQAQGITITPSSTLKYYEDDPEDIDYQHSTQASDYVLLVNIPEVGLYSGRLSNQFEPKLDVSIDLIERKTERELYSGWLYYGADASENADDQILADPKYRYASYGKAIEKKSELIESLREGIAKISKLAALQINKAFAHK